MNGDPRIVFDALNLLKIYYEKKCDAVILLSQTTKGQDYGNVTMDISCRIKRFTEKSINIELKIR